MKILKLLLKWVFKLFFLSLFVFSAYYIYFLETEKFEANSRIMIKDLSSKSSLSPLGTLLSVGSSEGLQDAKLLELYVLSDEMYTLLDENFKLTEYYSSSKIDIIHRLRVDTKVPFLILNKKNLLLKYKEDVKIIYDEPSSTISIGFLHADANQSKKIVKSIIFYATKKINFLEKENTTVMLKFLKEQEVEKYQKFIVSMKSLLNYQSEMKTFDPKIDIELKSSMIATLEIKLIQKEVEFNTKLQYMNANSSEMIIARNNIKNIKNKIEKIKNEITGSRDKEELNVNLSEFELLKSKVEFNKELYRQTLIKLEETKILVSQNAKNLIVITTAGIADSYSYPNKFKDTFTLWIILFFIFGVMGMIFKLIEDHKD